MRGTAAATPKNAHTMWAFFGGSGPGRKLPDHLPVDEFALAERNPGHGTVEESKDRRAAARHRGVEGPGSQQPLLHRTDGGMRGKDRRLEIVGHRRLPLRHGTPQPFGKGRLGNTGMHPGIRLAGRNPFGRFHDHERQARKVEGKGTHHLATPRAELRRIVDEKGGVAPQLGGPGDEFLRRKVQAEEVVQRQHHRRAVGRPAAQSGAERHPLVEADVHAPNTISFTHQGKGPQADVRLGRAVDNKPLLREGRAIARRARYLHLVVKPRNGHHHGFEIVVAVGPPAQDVETEVYFAVCFQNHGTKIGIFYFCRMKFRTEIEPSPVGATLGYENRILTLGSCFATAVAARLARAKFHVTENPSGILFNPLSIAAAIRSYAEAVPVGREELFFDGALWRHFGFHGDFAEPDPDRALQRMNAARQAGTEALRAADRVILTFGTAWVFEHKGMVVANCHRQPAAEFFRRRLSVAEIVGAFARVIEGPLAGKQVLLTVSPVRHLADGLAGNAVSKAVLRLAAEELVERFPTVSYFPAFEILTDDLRDYRFYADDLVHPAPQAVEYVWERVVADLLSEEARRRLPEVEAIVAAAAHRPRDPHGEAHRAFCRRQLERIAALSDLDFRSEAEYFRRCIEINS